MKMILIRRERKGKKRRLCPHIWANWTRSEKIFILCPFIFGKAKLVRAEKYRYHNVVKWYLLKMDSGIESEKKKQTTKLFHVFF